MENDGVLVLGCLIRKDADFVDRILMSVLDFTVCTRIY